MCIICTKVTMVTNIIIVLESFFPIARLTVSHISGKYNHLILIKLNI